MDMKLGDTRLIIDTCKRFGLLRNQAAYVLATAFHETAHTMKPVEEAFWLSDAWRKANLRYYPWHGRGYVQLTWEKNYVRAGRELNRDLTTTPATVMQPKISAEILVKGSLDGWFTGRKLGDYITLQKSNFVGARRIINGTDKASAIAGIAKDYDAALLREGYGVTDSLGLLPAPIADDEEEQPPRDHIGQSKTIRAQIVQTLSGGAAVVGALWNGSSETVQILLVIGMIAFLCAGYIVFRERLKKWADGIR